MNIVTHPTLYHRGQGGEIREWYMQVQYEDDDSASYRTVSGVLGGKMVESAWKAAKAKGVGKAYRHASIQAEMEVNSQYTKKKESKYHVSIDTIDTVEIKFDVMLADKYKEFPGPCFAQPKLDGMRMTKTNDSRESRGGKPIPGPIYHIDEALKFFFEKHPTARLDGELYNHEYKDDFNEIISAVKKATADPEKVARCQRVVQYHIYDCPSHPGTFVERWNFLTEELFGKLDKYDVIVPVGTLEVPTVGILDDLYGIWLQDGYEGQMIRLNTPYENKRTKALLKRKEFVDEEFELVSINEGQGNWAGVAKAVTCRWPGTDKTFNAGIKGTRARAKDLLHEKYDMVTVRYQNLTPDGVPRFPVAIKFWDKEALATGDRD